MEIFSLFFILVSLQTTDSHLVHLQYYGQGSVEQGKNRWTFSLEPFFKPGLIDFLQSRPLLSSRPTYSTKSLKISFRSKLIQYKQIKSRFIQLYQTNFLKIYFDIRSTTIYPHLRGTFFLKAFCHRWYYKIKLVIELTLM